jgi:hypothetical protein
MAKKHVLCPQCQSVRTAPSGKAIDLSTTINVTIGTFGLGLLIIIPLYFIERKARQYDPAYRFGYRCRNCGHWWLQTS